VGSEYCEFSDTPGSYSVRTIDQHAILPLVLEGVWCSCGEAFARGKRRVEEFLTYPPEAPVIRANLPRISFWSDMFEHNHFQISQEDNLMSSKVSATVRTKNPTFSCGDRGME
jgi:hypothetical protein